MLISVITINYNDKTGLENTIKSVQSQTFKDFEHIIIDGKSDDGSFHIIQKYITNFSYWVSESDSGIYNAMNKGIKVSSGEYLLFLNSGDILNNEEVLNRVAKNLIMDVDLFYGDVELVEINGKKKVHIFPDILTFNYLYVRNITHQAIFTKRSLFERLFYYNEHLKIVSDWEFLICALCKYNATYKHLDIIVSQYDRSGISSIPENKQLVLEERVAILIKHFPLFTNDYKEFNINRKILNSNRFKILLALEESTIAKKLNSLMLRVFLILFRGKKLNEL